MTVRAMVWAAESADDVDAGFDITADDVESAAAVLVERWWEGGAWSGEAVPDKVACVVVCEGVTYDVDVAIDWSPDFTPLEARPRTR